MQTNCSIIQFSPTSSCFSLSINSLLCTKLPKILTLCLLEAAPLPPVAVTLLHVGNVLSQSHTLSHSPPALSHQSRDRISHAVFISSTITLLLSYDCVGLWLVKGLWIVIALVILMLMANDLLPWSHLSIFCLYVKNKVVMRNSLLNACVNPPKSITV